jgi:hypothetical protein
MFEWMKNEKMRNRVETAVLIVAAVLILLLGVQAYNYVGSQITLTRELQTWAMQQRELMLRQAQQQGLLSQEEINGANNRPAEAVGGGTAPREPK